MFDRATSSRGTRLVLAGNHRSVTTGFLCAIKGFVGHFQQLLET